MTDPNRAKAENLAKSYKEDSDDQYTTGKDFLRSYEDTDNPVFLERAINQFKMALSRHMHSEHLGGNTLEQYIADQVEAYEKAVAAEIKEGGA